MPQTADPVSHKRERDLNDLYRIAVIATLAFVTVTFSALALVFVLRSRVPMNWRHIILPPILWFDTVVLIGSSITYEIGHRRLVENNQRAFYRWIGITTALGALFLLGQVAAWWQILASGQLVENNPHSTFFFLFSGMHGIHIIVGLAGLGRASRRAGRAGR